jgi:hypothetical protein
MAKMLNPKELASLTTRLLVGDMTTSQLDDRDRYGSFMEGIANVIAEHCGGEVTGAYFEQNVEDPDDNWLVSIHGNDSLPDDGGVWADYDPDGELDS